MNDIFFPARQQQVPYPVYEPALKKTGSFYCFLPDKKSNQLDSFNIEKPKQASSLRFGKDATDNVLEREKKALLDEESELRRIQSHFQNEALNLNDGRGLYNIYFDMPNNAVDRAGLCVRLRMNMIDSVYNQISIKTHGTLLDDGTSDRKEYEANLPSESRFRLDFEKLRHDKPEAIPVIDDIQALCDGDLNNLTVKFYSACHRTTFDLLLAVKGTKPEDIELLPSGQPVPEGAKTLDIELALDDTTIFGRKQNTQKREKIGSDYEVELEYKPEKSDRETLTKPEIIAGINKISSEIDKNIFQRELPWGGPSKQRRGYNAIEQSYGDAYQGWKPDDFRHLGEPITVVKFGQSSPIKKNSLSFIA